MWLRLTLLIVSLLLQLVRSGRVRDVQAHKKFYWFTYKCNQPCPHFCAPACSQQCCTTKSNPMADMMTVYNTMKACPTQCFQQCYPGCQPQCCNPQYQQMMKLYAKKLNKQPTFPQFAFSKFKRSLQQEEISLQQEEKT